MITDINNQLLDFEGRTSESAANRIEKDLREATEKAQAKIDAGDGTGQADLDRINRLKALLAAQARFNELQEQANNIVAARGIKEDELNNAVAQGQLTRKQANAELAQFETDYATKIDDIAIGMQKFADAVGDPKLSQAVAQIRIELGNWKVGSVTRDIEETKNRLEQVQGAFDLANQKIDTAVKNGLDSKSADEQREAALRTYTQQAERLLVTLEQIAAATHNTELQAYVDDARAGLKDLQADGDELGAEINQQFLGAFTDLFTSIADGSKSAKEAFADFGRSILKILTDIAIKIIITKLLMAALGGGGAGGAGGFLSGLFGGDKAVKGFASGGYTGDGGINDPAGITHGKEFVVNADATAKNRAALEAMNEGLNPQRNLAAGSNVSPAATMQAAVGSQNIQVVNVLPNDLLDNYVNSGNGTQTFLNMIENNATAINGRLKQGNG